jgi:hypothetical protein
MIKKLLNKVASASEIPSDPDATSMNESQKKGSPNSVIWTSCASPERVVP